MRKPFILAVLLMLVALLSGCVGGWRQQPPAGMIGAFIPKNLPASPVAGLPPVFQPGVWTFQGYVHPEVMHISLVITETGKVTAFNNGSPVSVKIKDGRIWLSHPDVSLFARPENNVVGICADLRMYGLAGQMFRARHPGEVPPPFPS